MRHLSTEGFTSLSQEELSALEGGGYLTDLTARLTAELTQVLDVVKDVSTTTSAFLKTIVDIIV
jgi:hypothetical protein